MKSQSGQDQSSLESKKDDVSKVPSKEVDKSKDGAINRILRDNLCIKYSKKLLSIIEKELTSNLSAVRDFYLLVTSLGIRNKNNSTE